MLHELRQSWRSLLRRENHAYTFATTATLALAIAAATAIVQLAYGVLWAPLPFDDATRLYRIDEVHAARGIAEYPTSQPNFLSWRERARSFEGLAATREGSANLGGDAGQPAQRVVTHTVTADLWHLLGTPLLIGRSFDVPATASGELVIGETLWRQRFDRSPGVLGTRMRVDGQMYTIVGVARQDMGFTVDSDLWLPMRANDSDSRGDRRLVVIARLRDGVGVAAAQAELEQIARALAAQFPDSNAGWSIHLRDARDWIVGRDARQRLLILVGAVLLLMLVAFTNVANLQIARATTRLHEMSVRQALGASRRRVAWMLTMENLSLVFAGATLGVAMAYALLRSADAWLPASLPRHGTIGFSIGVAAAMATLAGMCAMLFGATATAVAGRARAQHALGRAARGALGTHVAPLRDTLVTVQFTLATALVLVSALLAQQYLALRATEPGFSSAGVAIARIALPAPTDEAGHERSLAHFDRLTSAIAAVPGVRSVGLSSEIPMGELNTGMEVWGPNTSADSSDPGVQAAWRIITEGYLDTLRVPLMRGRGFARHDEPADSALISAGLAARLFPAGEDPIGQRLFLGNGQRKTVVGVVGDVRQTSLGEPATATLYFPTTWYLWPTMTIAARSDGDTAALIRTMRELGRRVSPDYPLFDVRSLSSVLAASIAQQRLQMGVIALFAVASLLLAALGVAGVMSYLVARRAPELALRMALGASHARTLRSVLARGMVLCAIGVLAGNVIALLVGRASFVPGTSGSMTALIAIPVAASLLLVGAAASWWPLRRIAHISPASLLRGDS